MRKVQQRGLLSVVGLLGVVLLGVVGCGGTSSDSDPAGHASRVTLHITTVEQTGGDTLRHATFPNSPRAVPTDPAFVGRLDIEVTGEGIPSPIAQSVDLTSEEITLIFGTFADNTGPFTLATAGQKAMGTVTILPPTSADTLRQSHPAGIPRQGDTSTSCHFTIETGSFLSGSGPQGRQILRMHPCETDALDGNLLLVNADTDARSTSAPPTPVGNAAPDGTIDTPAGTVTITAGEAVTFTATCGDPDSTTPVSAAWDFGGGAATVLIEDPGPVRFDTPGIFTVTLTCTDALGASDPTPDTRTVTVLGPVVPEPVPPNTLRIGSPSVPVTHAQTFPVAVEFNSSTTNVISYLIELKFNPAVVIVIEITKGSEVFDEPMTNPAAFSTGSVRFAANNPNFPPVSGQMTLANITFQVVGNAGDTSELTLDFPATPGGNGVIASDTFEPITITSIIPGTVAVQ